MMSPRALGPVFACLVLLVGCTRPLHRDDAGAGDGGATDGGPRDPTDLYSECALATGCAPAGQVCLPVRGNTRQSAWCTFRCADDVDCPDGVCVVTTGTVDDGPRCHEGCSTDADCDPGFACLHATITTTHGDFEADVCFPE